MSRKYGLPYQGSKNKIADWVISNLPKVENLYDVFAGGCAVSHAALLSGKFSKVHISDINDSVYLFRDMLEGNIPDGSEWISREDFLRRKDSDPYIRLVWSFGNNQRNYLYSRELEPYKKAVHEMIFAPTPNERRLKFREVCKLMQEVFFNRGGQTKRPRVNRTEPTNYPPPSWRFAESGTAPERMFRLQSAEALPPPMPETCSQQKQLRESISARTNGENRGGYERLQSKERRREISTTPFCSGEYDVKVADYREIEILPNSVIYCDIPYKGTNGYSDKKNDFDHEEFYRWCENQTAPVFISEYWMPEDRFICIASKDRTSTYSSTNNSLKKIEKIFIPKHQLDLWQNIRNQI